MNAPAKTALPGVVIMLTAMVIHLTCAREPFPGWGSNPFEAAGPIFGITPVVSMILDAIALVGCALASWPTTGGSRRAAAFLSLGAVAISYHAFFHRGGDLDAAVIGLNWLTSLACGLAIAQACVDARTRSIVAAALLGFLMLLAMKGALQVTVEHAETMADFKVNRLRFFASQGWPEGSFSARAYERRISQAEASGWIGFANVFATLMAAGAVAYAGLAIAALRHFGKSRRGVVLLVALGLVLCGVALAGAKGGYAATGLGLAILFVGARIPQRFARFAPLAGVLVVVGALSAVVLRGVISERIHELSLLFRSFYLEAAARIFAANPAWGVGPGGFKDAYLLLKNPKSPEDVTSPHSVLFDYAATLGIGGLAMGAVWMGLVMRAAGGLLAAQEESMLLHTKQTPTEQAPGDIRDDLRIVMIPAIMGILASAYLEQPIATATSTLLRLAGMAAFGVVGAAVLSLLRVRDSGSRFAVSAALSAAALTIAAHSQIELTFITPGAALWCAMVIGLAAARVQGRSTGAEPPRRFSAGRCLSALCCVSVAATAVMALPRTVGWESKLRGAYNMLRPVNDLSMRKLAIESAANKGTALTDDSPGQLINDLGRLLGHAVEGSTPSVETALDELRLRAAIEAYPTLAEAEKFWPTHFPTLRAIGQLGLDISRMESSDPRDPARARDAASKREEALKLARRSAATCGTSGAYVWLARVEEGVIQSPTPEQREQIYRDMDLAAQLAPFEPSHPASLARFLASTDPMAAAEYARRALMLDANLRLDPLRPMPEAERKLLEKIAAGVHEDPKK